MRVLVKIGVNADKKYDCDIPDDGTIKDLRKSVSGIENVAESRIIFIIMGSRIQGDDVPLKHLNLEKGVIVIISSAPKDDEKEAIDEDSYEVTFEKKPLGIRIQSNKKQINAYIVSYENDGAKDSGAQLGSKILAVNDTKVDGWKTVDIEAKILELDCPLKIMFLSREGMSGEELSQVEGLDGDRLPEKWVAVDEKDEKADSDYKVTFNTRPFGTVVFSGKGGRSAYIVSFEDDSVAPGLGVKAGSKIIAVNDLDVESWTAQHIQNEIMGKKVPLTLTLRGPEGLTAEEYPVSQSDTKEEEKPKKKKKDKKKKKKPEASKINDGEADSFMVFFDERPLGFGIMSPLGQGAMVSSVQNKKLTKKNLIPGTPIVSVAGTVVKDLPLAKVAQLISKTDLPMMIKFSNDMYFKPGDKVLVQYKDEWYKTTITKFNAANRKLSVTYDEKPFRFKNSEVIQDFTRIRKAQDFQRERILSIHT